MHILPLAALPRNYTISVRLRATDGRLLAQQDNWPVDGLLPTSQWRQGDYVADPHTLEILEQQPDVEMIFVPIGGGSGAAGACLVAKTINSSIQVIGVQASAAPAAYLTWKNRQHTSAQMETEAEGLATSSPFMLPQQILWQHLDDFLLVEEDGMRQAVRLYLEKAKTLTELAGAAPLAAALQVKERVRGKTIALIISGGNISPEKLRRCL